MANNYDLQTENIQQEDVVEGACALDPQLETLAMLQREHDEQQKQQQNFESSQQPAVQSSKSAISQSLNVSRSKPYTSIAVQGQKIKSKLNPLAAEFYPSYMHHPKNGYTTANMHHHHHHQQHQQQMPNAAAIAAAATAAQYNYLDYDCGYEDWPTYEYDVARYMDYERFMTSHMQRSNTAVTLVRNNYSGGSGSAAPPSGSTSFQDQPSFERLKRNRSFNRSYSSTSHHYRKHHKSSKEASRENMRSWYIDKKAEEKRMESWKNAASLEAYQDPIPGTSSKEEFFEAQSPLSDYKSMENGEEQNAKYIEPFNMPAPGMTGKEARSQRHTSRTEVAGLTETTPRKTRSQRKLKKEATEISKKKLIMLYPSKRDVNCDLTQSSQDSMFTQPNPIEYTSDESFLTQLSSSQMMESEIDKILNEVKEMELKAESKNQQQSCDTENTESLEEFEMTTKPSEPKILHSSDSVSPVSVIEQQEKSRRVEKILKTYLEPRTAINRPTKKEVERKPSRKYKSSIVEVSSITQRTSRPSSVEKDSIKREADESSKSQHKTTTTHNQMEKEPKMLLISKGKYIGPLTTDSTKKESRTSHKTTRSTLNANEFELKTSHKSTRVAAGNELNAVATAPMLLSKSNAVYTGAIPKTKESTKNKEPTTQPISTTTTKVAAKTSTPLAIPKIRELPVSHNRKVPPPPPVAASNDDTTSKTSRSTTSKSHHSTSHKDDKTKIDLWIPRPPNGIVANRVQIFANSSKPTAVVKIDAQQQLFEKSETTTQKKQHKETSKPTATNEKRHHKANAAETAATAVKQSSTIGGGGGSILKKSIASTAVSAASAPANTTTTTKPVEKRTIVPKSIIKTQMRSALSQEATTTTTTTNLMKKSNPSHNPLTSPKKESAESKKTKSTVIGNHHRSSVQASSSKAIKTGGGGGAGAAATKIPLREKSSSLRGVKAIIGSDGDKNAKVISSKSCISLRVNTRKSLAKKPSITSTKLSKKSTTASNSKSAKPREVVPAATELRSIQMEKRRNPYSDPGADYKIIQSSFSHK